MRATFERRELVAALRTVTPAAAKGPMLPVLCGVHIDVAPTGADLTCTNLDTTVATTVDAPGSQPGEAIVPAGMLARIVAAMAGENVVVEATGDGQVTVTSGEAVATLRALNVDDWPRLAEPDGETVELDATTVDLLARIAPMASTDATRQTLCGVRFGDGEAAATDSYRLGIVAGLPDGLGPAIVPADALKAALAAGGGVQVRTDGRTMSFAAGPTTVTARLIDGSFPDYRRLVHDPPETIVVDRDALAAAVDLVGLAATDANHTVALERDGGKLLLSSTDAEVGALADTIAASGTYQGKVAFNRGFLAALLDAVEPGDVTIRLTDDRRPAVVGTGRLTLLLMPVRVP